MSDDIQQTIDRADRRSAGSLGTSERGGGGGDGLPADGFLLHRGAELGTIRREQIRCRAAERE